MTTFKIKCPNCGEPVKLYGDDSSGPFSEVGGQCETCSAYVTQEVECYYQYNLIGYPMSTGGDEGDSMENAAANRNDSFGGSAANADAER